MNRSDLTPEGEEFLDDLAEELAVPPGRYEQAEASYASLGNWLHRDESSVRKYGPNVYVQGSFRLGTTIRPASDAEEYDVDSVCEFDKIAKLSVTQSDLKLLLGTEIEAYRRSRNMVKPVREGRRCWILDYADGAQFHMDVVPALPNGQNARLLLEKGGFSPQWAPTAIAITDNKSSTYHLKTEEWPRSNPKGYAEWFKSRMTVIFERRRRALADMAKASVESIPEYKVRTPLQSAAMILKRHRDHCFSDRPDERPISVIITTLAAHAYGGEETVGAALEAILTSMDRYIQNRNGKYWIPNPTDPFENFADKWAEHPERARTFFEWHGRAKREFLAALRSNDRQAISETIGQGVGKSLAGRVAAKRTSPGRSPLLKAASAAPAGTGLAFPAHGRVPTKPQGFGGKP